MDDSVYDTSWTLYHISSESAKYAGLLSTDPDSILSAATGLWKYVEDAISHNEDETDKTGATVSCAGMTYGAETGVRIELIYEKVRYKYLFLNPSLVSAIQHHSFPLLLAKSDPVHTRHVTEYMRQTFDVELSPLKLSGAFLEEALQRYLDTLLDDPSSDSIGGDGQFVQSILGNLKITVTFSAPVSPHLKTLDLDVPAESIASLLLRRHDGGDASKTLWDLLAGLVESRTGLRLQPINRREAGEEPPVMRLSKLSCAAFALGADGRLKLARRAVEVAAAFDSEALVRQGGEGMLNQIVAEARRRAAG